MIEIIPGILEKEWDAVEKKIEIARKFTNTIHIDLLDGTFVPNTSFMDPKPFAKYSNEIFFEVHMMVENPLQYLKPFSDAGFKRFIGHMEKMQNVSEFVAQGQLFGEVGIALDAGTSIDTITVSYDDIDFILLMTVKAGFSGQAFMPEQLEKVKKIREKTTIPLEVDGGINNETITLALQAGATRFVATSFLYDASNPPATAGEKYQELYKCLQGER